MERISKDAEIINDLMRINAECAETYAGIMPEFHDKPEEYRLLMRLVNEGRDFIKELRMRTVSAFGDPADAVDIKGEIYKVWQYRGNVMPVRNTEIFLCCEKKAKAAKKAYEKALQKATRFSGEVTDLLSDQLERVRGTFAVIRKCKKQTRLS